MYLVPEDLIRDVERRKTADVEGKSRERAGEQRREKRCLYSKVAGKTGRVRGLSQQQVEAHLA
jgi:hypothetical protein